jgi:hypothetical protein
MTTLAYDEQRLVEALRQARRGRLLSFPLDRDSASRGPASCRLTGDASKSTSASVWAANVEQMRLTIRLAGRLTDNSIPVPARERLLQAFRDWKSA